SSTYGSRRSSFGVSRTGTATSRMGVVELEQRTRQLARSEREVEELKSKLAALWKERDKLVRAERQARVEAATASSSLASALAERDALVKRCNGSETVARNRVAKEGKLKATEAEVLILRAATDNKEENIAEVEKDLTAACRLERENA
ncbi:unnamed protein product, partial [Discosporangium mesarthrocarpum]